jgi:hypothetical protein
MRHYEYLGRVESEDLLHELQYVHLIDVVHARDWIIYDYQLDVTLEILLHVVVKQLVVEEKQCEQIPLALTYISYG